MFCSKEFISYTPCRKDSSSTVAYCTTQGMAFVPDLLAHGGVIHYDQDDHRDSLQECGQKARITKTK